MIAFGVVAPIAGVGAPGFAALVWGAIVLVALTFAYLVWTILMRR